MPREAGLRSVEAVARGRVVVLLVNDKAICTFQDTTPAEVIAWLEARVRALNPDDGSPDPGPSPARWKMKLTGRRGEGKPRARSVRRPPA